MSHLFIFNFFFCGTVNRSYLQCKILRMKSFKVLCSDSGGMGLFAELDETTDTTLMSSH